MATDEVIKQLLEAGVHFGHQTKRWNPKMKKFIFGERSGIYIIDLEKTVQYINQARDFLFDLAAKGQIVLFIGTKKQAQDTISTEAQRAGMFFVNNRWLGGLLTNFQTVRKSIKRLKDLDKMKADGILDALTKKEVAGLNKEKGKLFLNLGGIQDMPGLPHAVIVVDTKKEEIAVAEANRLGIPIIGLIDTNCDPDLIDFPIPGNDDAVKSIKFIMGLLTDSVAEGRKQYLANEATRKQIEVKKQASAENKENSPSSEVNNTSV